MESSRLRRGPNTEEGGNTILLASEMVSTLQPEPRRNASAASVPFYQGSSNGTTSHNVCHGGNQHNGNTYNNIQLNFHLNFPQVCGAINEPIPSFELILIFYPHIARFVCSNLSRSLHIFARGSNTLLTPLRTVGNLVFDRTPLFPLSKEWCASNSCKWSILLCSNRPVQQL